MDWLGTITLRGMELLSTLFVLAVGFTALAILVMWIIDRVQTKDSVRHNFPVMGRFRYLFGHLGEFFRQYFYAMDREEMPFNRAERDWIYKSVHGGNNTAPFGSTRNLLVPGTPIFAPASFATLEDDAEEAPPVVFGPYTAQPYEARSLINVSGMSFGALSAPAVRALSHGAAKAGCWLNTGEGGLSPYHLEGGADIVFQIGTAKYGVRDAAGGLSDERLKALGAEPRVKMFEIKLSQGAKVMYARDEAHREELTKKEFNARGKIEVSRFKGLGEMLPGQLKETTMDPAKRTLLRVQIVGEDATGSAIDSLMGNKPEERFRFIQERAEFAEDLDI